MQALCIILQFALLAGLQEGSRPEPPVTPLLELTSRVDEVMITSSGATLTRLVDAELEEGITRLRITLWDEQGSPLGSVQSHTGEGSWPAGPLRLDEVSWSVLSLGQSGTLPTLVWEPGTRFGCGGCALESLLR